MYFGRRHLVIYNTDNIQLLIIIIDWDGWKYKKLNRTKTWTLES